MTARKKRIGRKKAQEAQKENQEEQKRVLTH